MDLTSQIIYQTNKDMSELEMQEYEKDIREFECVEKGELQYFLAYLWRRYMRLERRWENLDDELSL
jgi:hypothetical protein